MCAKLRVVREDDPNEPIDRYQSEVNKKTTSTVPYERLMIHYRKQKDYKQEVDVIQKGIKMLENFYDFQQKQTFKKRLNPKLETLSKKFGKSTGLLDKKGKEIYMPEPLPKWIKRLAVAEEKLKKASAKPAKKKKSKK